MDLGRRKSYHLKQMDKNHILNTLNLFQVISLMLFIYFLILQFHLAKVNALYIFPFSFPIQASPLPSALCHLLDEAQLLWKGSMICLSWPSSQAAVLTRIYFCLSSLVTSFASLKRQNCSPSMASVSNRAPQTERPKLV